MKFMSSFQCLMGGNAVQFQASSSVSPTNQSSLPLLDNENRRNSNMTKKKKKKKKKDRKVIKVFKPDGEINLYHKPIRVSEVMTEEYMVCRSDSFYIGQKIPPLSQHERLQPGHTYFLLPTHLFHSVLSFVTIASFTASSKQDREDSNGNMKMKAAFLKKAAASSCSPFDIQKTSSGTLRIRVSELFISQLMMDQAATAATGNHHRGKELIDLKEAADLLCTTPQLHREYKQLVVGSRRGWKPKLEMIKETPSKGKRKVKMLFSASISRMKKKIKNNKNVGFPQISSSSASSQSQSSLKKKKKKTKKIVQPPVSLPPSPAYASTISRTK
ncbi:unnamed protein product [Lactuca virosa]|uniref:Uncharacterized protein n=1 Tax=Lactuca virosa TaxID=75947 RepID=A0AAU9LTW7_9ASTR|nr:unnamed protein product [Lactuca virosa]